jgi:hypothetical protein
MRVPGVLSRLLPNGEADLNEKRGGHVFDEEISQWIIGEK